MESEQAAVSGEVTKPATCTEKGETTYTAVFESDWAVTQTKVLEDVEMLPHSYGAEWESDETGHWAYVRCLQGQRQTRKVILLNGS